MSCIPQLAPPTINLLASLPLAPQRIASEPLVREPSARDVEVIETLLTRGGVRIDRIVSRGQVTPEGCWYDQPETEWVLLLTGHARLLIEGEVGPRELGPGDAVLLPAHCRHRVTWTDPDVATVWLAVWLT
jgi:cupin 2 domain-containing protein